MLEENRFNPSLPWEYSIFVERAMTVVQPHPQGYLSLFDKLKRSYYLLDTNEKSVQKKIPLELAKGDYPEFGRLSMAEEIPRLAFIETSEESVKVLDGARGEVSATLSGSKGKIESIYLSPDGKRLYMGGKDGLITLWDVEQKSIITQVSKHQDFVYLIKESPCREFIVSIGYDRSVFLYRRGQGNRGERVYVASFLPRCMVFLEGGYVAIGESQGDVVILDCQRGKPVNRFHASHEEIISMAALDDETLFFLSKFGKLGSVDFRQGIVRSDDYMETKRRYSAFALDPLGKMILATNDGYIRSCDLKELSPWLKRLIDSREIKHAYELLNEHPHLRGEESARRLEARFEVTLMEAQGLLEEERLEEAQQLLANYLQVPEKRVIVQKNLEQLRQIGDLRSYLKNSYLLRAYSLVQTRPLLAQTPVAKIMEERFLKAILVANELLKQGRRDEADKVVFAYKAINKRLKMIKEVFADPLLIEVTLRAIQEGNYRQYFDLKRQYEVVSILPEARAFEERQEEFYFELEEAFYGGDIKRAKECAEILRHFPKGEEAMKEWLDQIEGLVERQDREAE